MMFTGTDLGEISLNQSTTNIYNLQAFVSETFQHLNSKAPRRGHLMKNRVKNKGHILSV